MQRDGLRLAAALAPLLLCACPPRMDVQVIRYPEAADVVAGGPHCGPEHLEPGDPRIERCRALGDVFIGDTWVSDDCHRSRVLADVDSVACRLGANAVEIRRVVDVNSSCYQVRAVLMHCPQAAEVDAP